MFGIIDENKKFILLDDNHETLRTTALILAKKIENNYIQMFTEENVDKSIVEYTNEDIDTFYNGDKYLKGYAPTINN